MTEVPAGERPLDGCHVVLTRAPGADDGSADALAALGARVSVIPLIRIVPLPFSGPAPEAAHYDWLACTSQHAVRRFTEVADVAAWRARRTEYERPRVAAVGAATAAALGDLGLAPDVVPARASGAALGEVLLADGLVAEGARVCFPCAALARDEFPDRLRSAGVRLDALVLYRTDADADGAAAIGAGARVGSFDAIVLASGSAARALAPRLDDAGRRQLPLVAIGPSTAADAREAGLTVHAVAAEPTPSGVAAAVVAALAERQPLAASPSIQVASAHALRA